MKISDILVEKTPHLSFEVFPPKTDAAYEGVLKATEAIAELKPSYMSVTYGAGGGTSKNTVKIASHIKDKYNVPSLAHLTCVSSTKEEVHQVIDQLKASPSSVWYGLIFMFLTALIVYNGVEKGIERVSKFIMPVLLIMVIGIAIFSLTLKTTLDDGTVRTGLQGLKVYMKPDLTGITVGRFLQITLDAMSQLFFSLSVSMGIMITYGSYVKKDVDLNKAVSQIEIMDTGVAFLAGVMIIPAVFVFSGLDGMSAGPGLMFVSLPKVFYSMGTVGRVIGILFFVLAGFAALTSCISVLESITANCMELFHTERKKTTRVLSVIYLIATAVIALGYSIFYVEVALPNGSTGQLLDIMDYISNSFMMPFISLLSAILIGWIMKPSWIAEEMELNGEKFKRKKLYNVMMRYIMPVIMVILFLQSTGVLNLIMK